MVKRGKLLVISGPSGTGKSTVIGRLMTRMDHLEFSVSATTRPPRPGEKDGVDYFFVTKERFDEMVENDELLEHAAFVGNSYGTPRSQVEDRLEQGISVILDIEVQGAAQVKAVQLYVYELSGPFDGAAVAYKSHLPDILGKRRIVEYF